MIPCCPSFLPLLLLGAAVLHGASSQEVFLPASDPRFVYNGRTQVNDSDGTVSFDWEGVSITLTVSNTRYMKAQFMTLSGNVSSRTKIVCDEPSATSAPHVNYSQGFSISEFFVDEFGGGMSNNTYFAASGLDRSQNYTLRLFNALEPLFHGLDGDGYNSGVITFLGVFLEPGAMALPTAPTSPRSLEWVGDSLTAGFGSRGVSPPCETSQLSSSYYYSYSNYVNEALKLGSSSTIAWSGKGMWKNCCDDDETMPSYYLQTLGSSIYSQDWDFSRFKPSAIAINLGSNDMSKYNNTPAYVRQFADVYEDFLRNVTTLYSHPDY